MTCVNFQITQRVHVKHEFSCYSRNLWQAQFPCFLNPARGDVIKCCSKQAALYSVYASRWRSNIEELSRKYQAIILVTYRKKFPKMMLKTLIAISVISFTAAASFNEENSWLTNQENDDVIFTRDKKGSGNCCRRTGYNFVTYDKAGGSRKGECMKYLDEIKSASCRKTIDKILNKHGGSSICRVGNSKVVLLEGKIYKTMNTLSECPHYG
ncbi:uncharacterized protein LOC114541819 [Dendronephthya gigantea]|uniref:uncharacterized protein LOC114541819 n=1 Tax=Dendronephthya gigantea TaxID=151771 RepID=UPI00106D588B|nr:uncharacterized protein LOC114541819 [Dendronephthya gigantea]